MKTDRQLQEDILRALEFEPGVDAAKVGVSVKDGVATLQGTVRSYFERSTADRVTRNVYGVRAVANDLAVSLEGHHVRTDSDIATAVANTLGYDAAVPLNTVKATVADGWVTLNGTVDWQYQKTAAQHDVEHLVGVKGVTNLVALKPHVMPSDVKTKIEDAFKRSAQVEAARIKVQAYDGGVTLSGTVKSLAERDEAERAAWAAPGVTRVDDRIAVVP
jgi:osmotically-inducible protein OsmY